MDLHVLLQSAASGLAIGGVYALVAVGLALIFGVLKIVNFAHGEFVMLGMFLTYACYVFLGIHPLLSIFITLPSFWVLGYLLEKGLIERTLSNEVDIQILITIGLGAVIQGICTYLFNPEFRTIQVPGLSGTLNVGGGVVISITKLFACLLALLFTGGIFLFLKISDVGKAIRACADNPRGAMLVGIHVKKMRAIAFGLGIAMVGVAGNLVMPFLNVSPQVGSAFTLRAFVIVVLGGMGNLFGALVGGLIVGLVEGISAGVLSDSLKQVPVFVLFLLILYLRPNGLFGTPQ
jgi:branched-chain amino acid transport system permease protein